MSDTERGRRGTVFLVEEDLDEDATRSVQAGAYLWAGEGPPPPGLLPLVDPDDDNHDGWSGIG